MLVISHIQYECDQRPEAKEYWLKQVESIAKSCAAALMAVRQSFCLLVYGVHLN